jgi:hypothetical protein
MPADITAIVHPPRHETLRIDMLYQPCGSSVKLGW